MKAVVNNIGLDRVKNNNVSCTGIIALVRRDAATILSSGTTDPLARGRQDGNGMTSVKADRALFISNFDFDRTSYGQL
ncbi:hypothetical protein PR202_ga01507 [Eleusine coracana subsp. coracana]|uniref:Uncharacterized protein n=1 Tax=Eleusine coracana subsp. coracana TaxID=191504 RepID=A0AAV5BJ18_ELECO|nr:hypothetical protein PR202_ga00820 [Eleusine coracana subsp. coracana]GJM85714.1 hypothetical protein PR202_ga01507 [Eleusine coracana subsp. coracana]